MTPLPLYQFIASKLLAMQNCQRSGNTDWADKHRAAIEAACEDQMPSGSGFDMGVGLQFDKSTPDKLVFDAPYHHMDDNGMYSGWTGHQVIVTPSLCFDFDMRITGRDRNGIKDYIADTFSHALRAPSKE